MTARPTVTIITPVLNRAGMMPAALESLAAQACPSLEHIVVDGGSTDGTQQLAADAGAQVIEAPGTSIYEALNIGLGAASGDLVGLLNSDDVYAPAAVARARAAFAQDGALEIVRGRAATELFADGRWQTSDPTPGPDPALTLDSVLFGASNINACFFRPSLIARVGLFDTNYPISADREWLMRAILAGAPAEPFTTRSMCTAPILARSPSGETNQLRQPGSSNTRLSPRPRSHAPG
ncbi:MAG: glycosyltransferase [Hyphomonadaceae bacterium]